MVNSIFSPREITWQMQVERRFDVIHAAVAEAHQHVLLSTRTISASNTWLLPSNSCSAWPALMRSTRPTWLAASR